jgi:hypothetical protein
MITDFSIEAKQVTWQHAGQLIRLRFQYPVAAHHIQYLDEVLIQSDAREWGSQNLTIYSADGSVRARPAMPTLRQPVHGVYAVWFEQGQRQQTVVLLTDECHPYDAACTFDLETHGFSNIHPTK